MTSVFLNWTKELLKFIVIQYKNDLLWNTCNSVLLHKNPQLSPNITQTATMHISSFCYTHDIVKHKCYDNEIIGL